jgi:hypothetical protein
MFNTLVFCDFILNNDHLIHQGNLVYTKKYIVVLIYTRLIKNMVLRKFYELIVAAKVHLINQGNLVYTKKYTVVLI